MVNLTPKRLFDVLLLLPFLPAVAVAVLGLALLVLWKDGRPVFFSQPRVGWKGRPFRIWKLRTLTCDPDLTQRCPTALGKWLRQRGWDELPQLYNVLRGDMSLVGPRPLTPADAERLTLAHKAFRARLDVPPGLTGLSQVCLARGAALTARLDAHYARQRTVAMDLSLLLRTAWMNVVGKQAGARPIPELPNE
jgi:lipopolysaccharide/colanic/teichoic acid biosynthesis glycosyltransferase